MRCAPLGLLLLLGCDREEPQELAGAVQRPAVRSQAVQGMVVLSLLDEEAQDTELGLGTTGRIFA